MDRVTSTRRSPPALPPPAQSEAMLRKQRQTALVVGLSGIVGLVFALWLIDFVGAFLGLATIMLAGFGVMSCVGRLWAMGGVRLDRWHGAAASLWFVEDAEVETDYEDDAVWYHLTLSAATASDASANSTSAPMKRVLPIRLVPRSLGTSCDWPGKYLVLLTATDGTQIAHLHGKSRFWRAGGDGPWDWLLGN